MSVRNAPFIIAGLKRIEAKSVLRVRRNTGLRTWTGSEEPEDA